MPFTPKFVDLVRNLTSTSGTGPIALGAPVSGFTGIGSALTVGEQFYYCMQSIEKPNEREIGRGTLLANGSVAREAINGSLTSFTSGTKTIALVTAAEWFAKIEQGGSASSGGGSGSAVTGLTELAALPTANGAAATLTAKGREGLFVFDTANLAAMVTADARKAIYVAPASAPSGASGAWVRRFDGTVQLQWFGPAGDFTTNDLPAFEAAHDVIKARSIGGFPGAAVLDIGPGRFYLAGTWNIHTCLQIRGAGSAQPYGAATLLRFGKNINGIVLNHGNTHGDTVGTQGSAEGSVLEGVQLWGGNVNVSGAGVVTTFAAGDSTSGHGVRIRGAFIECRDVASYFFGGDGFNIVATAGAGGAVQGNANSFVLDRCQAQYNRGNGFVVAGTDANAGKIDTCSAISNGGAGFLEYSFLGNSYIACHVRDCGKSDPANANGPVGICTSGGNAYYVVAGQEAGASTVTPGSNAAVWAPYQGGGASRAWVSGQVWVNPSPYGTNPANVNGRNIFLGCYAESGQAPCQATYPSQFIGGLLDEVDVVGSATWVRGTAGGGLGVGEIVSINPDDGNTGTTFGGPNGKTIFNHRRVGVVAELRGRDDFFGGSVVEMMLNNSLVALNISVDADGPYEYAAMAVSRLWVGAAGGVNSARRVRGIGALADLNGMVLGQGDLFINHAVTVGTPGIYMCTTAGTYGSGAVVTALPPAGLVEATSTELWAGTSQAKFVSPKRIYDAAAPVVVGDGASITLDGGAGINFNLTLGGNRTLANPVGMKPGQSGRIRVRQDATGGRTLAYGTNWLFAGGDPVLSTAANAIDVIAYFANSATEIEATIVKALS